jgi:hypothetical protein
VAGAAAADAGSVAAFIAAKFLGDCRGGVFGVEGFLAIGRFTNSAHDDPSCVMVHFMSSEKFLRLWKSSSSPPPEALKTVAFATQKLPVWFRFSRKRRNARKNAPRPRTLET